MAEPTLKGIELTLSPADRVKHFLLHDIGGKPNYNGFDKDLITNDIRLISASPDGEVVFELTVREAHTNRLGSMHGGCVALVMDLCTTAALVPIAKEGYWQYLGVTRSLNVTYIRPARIGETVIITATVVNAGSRLATIRGVITNKETGKVCSTVEHLKFNSTPPNSAAKL